MTKLPHMPLWVYDLETDETCRLMSHAEFGLYMRLLIRQWIESSIPADISKVARLAGGDAHDTEELLRGFVDEKMPVQSDGRRRNDRLARERERVLAKIQTLRANFHPNAPPNGNANDNPSGGKRASESVSDSESGSVGSGVRGVGEGVYRRIYDAYPRKVGKASALKAIGKAVGVIADSRSIPKLDAADWLHGQVVAYAASPCVTTQSQEFIPHPATWFNAGRYDDDPTEWNRSAGTSRNGHAAKDEPTIAELRAARNRGKTP